MKKKNGLPIFSLPPTPNGLYSYNYIFFPNGLLFNGFLALRNIQSSCKIMLSWALASNGSWTSFENRVPLIPRGWEPSCSERGTSAWGHSRWVVRSILLIVFWFLPLTSCVISGKSGNTRVWFLSVTGDWKTFQFSLCSNKGYRWCWCLLLTVLPVLPGRLSVVRNCPSEAQGWSDGRR